MERPALLWFRQDLRLADNPALSEAIRSGGPVVPVFIWAPEEEEKWQSGAASRWWLRQSLRALDQSLRRLGSKLIVRRGKSSEELSQIATEIRAETILWNRRYEPALMRRDRQTEASLRRAGLRVETFNGHLLFEPAEILNKSGKPFRVFTPFWKNCCSVAHITEPLRAPGRLPTPLRWPKSLQIDELELEPTIDWASGIRKEWQPGEAGAEQRLKEFIAHHLLDYGELRDRPGIEGTSKLSPHLHFGEIGPRQIWQAVSKFAEARDIPRATWMKWQFLAELGWREFGHYLLYHFPEMPDQPLQSDFSRLRWRKNQNWLKAWQQGRTGCPIVDAGMRQLWSTGWMHNRARMVVGSFLTKDLLLDWREGERWFWDTLVDADLANNSLGWQWIAGCGADAMPFFRIFNPAGQGEKFDADGAYLRRWIPELARLSDRWIHRPWEAPEDSLRQAGVELGRTYPKPIVSHSIAREVALEAYQKHAST